MAKKPNSSESLHFRLQRYAKKGGKIHRKEKVKKVYRFIKFCGCPGAQIGNKHVKRFFSETNYSTKTQLDYFYAISLLWKELGRSRPPPRPPSAQDKTQ